MPMYEYEYKNKEGKTVRVEKVFKINEAPLWIPVDNEEGTSWYKAERIISLTARMKNQWDSYEPSDLPPVDSPLIGQ